MEDERPARDRVLALADELSRLVLDRGRDDLASRLRDVTDKLSDRTITVVVAGEFKQGKSSLVNALLGRDLCTVDDAVATAVPTFIRHAATPTASAMFGSRLEQRRLDDLAALTVELDQRSTVAAERPTSVHVGLPAPILERGIVLVDTPGLGGLDSRVGAATLAAVGWAADAGAHVLRVHDVEAAADFLAVRAVLRGDRVLDRLDGLTPDRYPDGMPPSVRRNAR
jgi:hypothetical protein